MLHFSRRGFLRNTLGAAWTGATLLEQSVFRAAAARAQSPGAATALFDIEKVADGGEVCEQWRRKPFAMPE